MKTVPTSPMALLEFLESTFGMWVRFSGIIFQVNNTLEIAHHLSMLLIYEVAFIQWLYIRDVTALVSDHAGMIIGHEDLFYAVLLLIFLLHLFIISSASMLSPYHFLSFNEPLLHEIFPLVSLIFLKIYLVFPFYYFSSVFFADHEEELCYHWL